MQTIYWIRNEYPKYLRDFITQPTKNDLIKTQQGNKWTFSKEGTQIARYENMLSITNTSGKYHLKHSELSFAHNRMFIIKKKSYMVLLGCGENKTVHY